MVCMGVFLGGRAESMSSICCKLEMLHFNGMTHEGSNPDQGPNLIPEQGMQVCPSPCKLSCLQASCRRINLERKRDGQI